jgi:hypothetical protein
VVVPACDESLLVADAIGAIARARQRLPMGVSSSLVVVADGCTDATATIASGLRSHPGDLVLETAPSGVGAARRLGTAAGLAAAPVAATGVWIASTDADTVVPAEWLTAQLEHAALGATAVAGTVELADDHPDDTLAAVVAQRFRARYTVAGGTHTHVHGANLGMRADAYERAGGWRTLATAEDHDLWRRLRRLGPTVSTTALPVITSARRSGRAPMGFAVGLAQLAEAVA